LALLSTRDVPSHWTWSDSNPLLFGDRPETLQVGNQLLATGCDRVGDGGRRPGIDAPFNQGDVLQFAQPFHHHAPGGRDGARQLIEPGRPFRQDKQNSRRPPLEQQGKDGWVIVAVGSNDDDSNDP
jgi:hypothetical protein